MRLNSILATLAVALGVALTALPARATLTPVAPIYLNKTHPGAKVDIRSHLVPGRTNIVEFYGDF